MAGVKGLGPSGGPQEHLFFFGWFKYRYKQHGFFLEQDGGRSVPASVHVAVLMENQGTDVFRPIFLLDAVIGEADGESQEVVHFDAGFRKNANGLYAPFFFHHGVKVFRHLGICFLIGIFINPLHRFWLCFGH